MSSDNNYQSWTKTGLIERVKELEKELKRRPAPPAVPGPAPLPKSENEEQDGKPDGKQAKKPPKGKRKMDPSKYSTRYIALKLAYLGKNYGGFEFQAMANLPSIEEELWNALTKACLIFPKDERVVDFDCCEYSKCGRTDRGVSAFGQVIGLRVRSNRPVAKKRRRLSEGVQGDDAMAVDERPDETGEGDSQATGFDPILDEIHYPRVLNRLLPPDIRVLAWCPSPPPGFSARFSCRERQYRYFFTQPAFTPEPTAPESGLDANGLKPGWLDIEAMRDAAKQYEGEHDFRNFCKVDPAKQITNFRRMIYEAGVEEVKDVSSALPYLASSGFAPADIDVQGTTFPKVYCFRVRGSAFLWHQIRHMVALLFLVGQRLESPSAIGELLDTATNPCKPNYVMADGVPLVLWDCNFPGDDGQLSSNALKWIYLSEDPALNKFGQFGVMDGMWSLWRGRKMDELLANQLLQLISQQGDRRKQIERKEAAGKTNASTLVYEGGNNGRQGGRYVPIMKKDRLQSPEEQNERYAKRKGYESAADMRRKKGFRNADEFIAE